MSKVVILDPSVTRDSRSHHLNAMAGHALAFSRAGHRVTLATNAGCRLELPDLQIIPAFDYTIYDDIRRGTASTYMRPFLRPYYRYLVGKSRKAVKAVLRESGAGGTDHVFIPTVDWILLRALAQAFAAHAHPPYLHLLFMYEQAAWMTGGYPYNKVIEALDTFSHHKRFVYTETTAHASNLEKVLGYTPLRYPYPAVPVKAARAAPGGGAIRVGALGGGRRDKGYGLLPAIIDAFNRRNAGRFDVKFVVQRARVEDRLGEETRRLERMSNVEVLDNELSRADYEQTLLSCDVTLHPYSRVYETRGSGIVNESLANGIPVLCSSGTALAEAILCGNGATAGTVEEFSEKLHHLVENRDLYRRRAGQARALHLERLYNNPVIRNIDVINEKTN